MGKINGEKQRIAAINKELREIAKQEEKLRKAADRAETANWKDALEKKIPDKVYGTLKKTFCKAFAVIFEKGTGIIEKSYDKESLDKDYDVKNYAVQVKGGRRELRSIKKGVQKAGMKNMALTTAEGIGLGALGVGMPDIVMFVGMLLRGIYESALHYGIDYRKPEEQMLILKMMETAVSKGKHWALLDREVNEMLLYKASEPEKTELDKQIERTAGAFAIDMLILKFVQGYPIVGIIGGMGNPVYYRKVMKYVEVKYHRRYLQGLIDEGGTGPLIV